MKKSLFFISIFPMILLAGCEKTLPAKIKIEPNSERSSFESRISISPMDESVTVSRSQIILAPKSENMTYTLSGYFDGQIIVNTKNTVLKLKDAYIENSSGKEAIVANAKTELSTAKDSVNYIVSRGRSLLKKAALESKKPLVLGGSGTLFVKGFVCHAVEAEDVKIKGSGAFYFEGTRRGSALTCQTFEVEDGKTFTAFFLNSKNGIKAERTVTVNSGNLHFYSNGTAIKTDIKEDSPKYAHGITLNGGNIYLEGNGRDYITDEGALVIKTGISDEKALKEAM